MSPLSSINSAAVLILQQASQSYGAADKPKSAGDVLTAAANGAAAPGLAGPSTTSRQAQAKITEALTGPSVFDIAEMKVNLMLRVGEAFGVSMDDFASLASFGSAIADIIEDIKSLPGGPKMLAEIGDQLGLDDLGVSLDEVVSAMTDPGGDEDKKLDAALGKQLGKDADERTADGAKALQALLQPDEMGLYGI